MPAHAGSSLIRVPVLTVYLPRRAQRQSSQREAELSTPAGLVGDGNTDNTSILQQAINQGPVALPVGIFRTGPLSLPQATTITGPGSYKAVLSMATPGVSALTGTDTSRITLRGIGLTGPGQNSGSGDGIHFSRSANPNTFGLVLDDVIVQEFGGNGIWLSNPIVSTCNRVLV